MAQINETNQQYYAGAQGFKVEAAAGQSSFDFTFDTDLVLGNWDPNQADYVLNNFKLYHSADGLTYTEITGGPYAPYTLNGNTISLASAVPQNEVIVCQLKKLDGGNYGARDAYGVTTEQNYGSYAYNTLGDIVDNFMIGYVGDGKIIQTCKKSDVIFFAKRALQEFSYDTLKSVKSQELTVPPGLSIVIPQDYVNYVRMSWIDMQGVQRIIYPANNLTDSPYTMPVQDQSGVPTQDNFGRNIQGTSITEERWRNNNPNLIDQLYNQEQYNAGLDWWGYEWGYGGMWFWGYGQLYGNDPQYSQYNGWFYMNEREGKISFSNNLVGRLIILEYISDGLAYDLDSRIPKLAEDALYAYIVSNIVSFRAGQPEYLVQRLKKEAKAKLRNAKIRLSNIKLDEIVQVMRGKSKWIKH
tara:strand:+ start:2068 stop:3303 length:1236 start_codon:yes stop_codon:yes gene_type:complete